MEDVQKKRVTSSEDFGRYGIRGYSFPVFEDSGSTFDLFQGGGCTRPTGAGKEAELAMLSRESTIGTWNELEK